MSQRKTLGGNRLGSGKKIQVELHDLPRSNHDLSRVWRSTMTSGVITPFFKELLLPGDSFKIDLSAMVRTVPTSAPLLGAYKIQMDVFKCPIRLYQGVLHLNAPEIGLKMQNVNLPQIELPMVSQAEWEAQEDALKNGLPNIDINNIQHSPSSLLAYMGIRGVGIDTRPTISPSQTTKRKFNAVPILAYYDIVYNYYTNKQEDQAYVISAKSATAEITTITKIDTNSVKINKARSYSNNRDTISGQQLPVVGYWPNTSTGDPVINVGDTIIIQGANLGGNTPTFDGQPLTDFFVLKDADAQGMWQQWECTTKGEFDGGGEHTFAVGDYNPKDITIIPFDLSNFNSIKQDVLALNKQGSQYVINNTTATLQPLKSLVTADSGSLTYNRYDLNGLCLKTYQSDIFNNWLSTEWLDGPGGINEITRVKVDIDTTKNEGSFTQESLILARKIYDLLNRIAVSGGTYKDWTESVYDISARNTIEVPQYVGGMSAQVVFEEVVSTCADEEGNPLGTLAGKGTLDNGRNGHVVVKDTEPCYIIGLVSITPYIDYCQGNKWDMSELKTMDDLHKPLLDQIGFQELITEKMAWWDVHTDKSGNIVRKSAGKQPAWIDYMTSYSEVYGDLADCNKMKSWVLARNYDYNDTNNILDVTTYIDPTKYNYPFSDLSITSQPFITQIGISCYARRVMSAKVMPSY